jgi:site-specific DNA recombinase
MTQATDIAAASLLRVSTFAQATEGTSLDTQAEANEGFIGAHGWRFVQHYVEDEGVSGAKEEQDRPDVARLLADVRAGRVQVVVVYKVDRYARDTLTFLQSIKQIEAAGAMLLSASEPWDATTPAGRLQRTMLAVFAGFEREQIIERTSRGLRAVARMGYWPGGPPPYGFAVEPVEGTKHKRLAVNEVEARAVRLAVDMLIEGKTTQEVADRLNAEDAPRRKAARWTHAGVRRMLKEIPLSGTWEYARQRPKSQHQAKGEALTVEVPALITPERERQLQAALARTASPHVHDQFYVFAKGTVKGRCGANYFGTYWRVRGYRQYQCVGTTWDAEDRCDCRRIDADQLEGAVWAEVTALLSDPERLLSMARDYLGLRREQVGVERGQLATVRSKIARLERSLSETVVEYAKAGLPAAALTEATRALQDELQSLRDHEARLEAWQAENVAESGRMRRLWELADLAATRLATMTPQQRRHVLALLDVRVTVLGWDHCPECLGRGKVKGGKGGVRCPRCVGLKQIATVRVEGTVYDRLLDVLDRTDDGGDYAAVAAGNVCEDSDVTPRGPAPRPRWPRRAPCGESPPPSGAGRPRAGRRAPAASACGPRWAGERRSRRPPRPRRPAATDRARPHST